MCDVLKEHKDEFVALNVDVYDLGSHCTQKGDDALCASGCTVAPSITSTCLRAGWLMGNMKSRYLQYEVSGDKCFGRAVSVLNPATYHFAGSCYYFETTYGTSVQL